jgi:acetoacetyl-CoA synthetase
MPVKASHVRQGILDRYRQIRPKFVFAETEVTYAGKTINLLEKTSVIVRDLIDKGLYRAVLLPSMTTGKDIPQDIPQRFVMYLKCAKQCFILTRRISISLSAFLDTGDNRQLTFAQLPFDHPVFILYSSGTTGKPKCIVHSAGVGDLSAFMTGGVIETVLGRAIANKERRQTCV